MSLCYCITVSFPHSDQTMKLTHFRDLLAVVRTGSLRSASRHLGIAQPVITRSIRELERELGQTE